ncbi:hypothetical protein RRG08_009975 [Elysia crispata]|uniref:Uncharacterized protein n=1 Tax=Elysia crispata TaxID=231223 RepID=A0AAE1B4J0_9GAST|nr:hypothetical protein RRG08_009975 [Elysia crispata]
MTIRNSTVYVKTVGWKNALILQTSNTRRKGPQGGQARESNGQEGVNAVFSLTPGCRIIVPATRWSPAPNCCNY